jgi:hypothetical protein
MKPPSRCENCPNFIDETGAMFPGPPAAACNKRGREMALYPDVDRETGGIIWPRPGDCPELEAWKAQAEDAEDERREMIELDAAADREEARSTAD